MLSQTPRDSGLKTKSYVSTLTVISVQDMLTKTKPKNAEYEFSNVMSLSIKETIAKRCAERRVKQPDEWVDAVSHRMACINYLPAEAAIYHRRCFQYFMSSRNLKLDALSITKDGAPPKKTRTSKRISR